MKKTLTMDGVTALKIYPKAAPELKTILDETFGREFFSNSGVWILTANNEAVKTSDWETLKSQNPQTKAVGIGVISDKTAFVVSLQATAALQWGAKWFDDYSDICKDQESYDNEATTTAIIERHRDVECKYSDSGKFDFAGAPAAEWCRSLGEEWSLPTLATAKEIAEHIKPINEALRMCGSYNIPAGWFWTSTVNDPGGAYVVYMGDGDVGGDNKDCGSYVRAVSAFQIDNFDFLNF